MRYFRVVRVGLVNRICLPLRNIDCHRLARVALGRVVWLAVALHEICQPRIWACGVVRRIGHREDGFVRSFRKSLLLAESRIPELLGQQLQKMLPPRSVAWKGEPEAFDRSLCAGPTVVEI